MSVSILEALQNADYNLNQSNSFSYAIAKSQLHNAVGLLLKGYSLSDQISILLEKCDGIVENISEKKGE